MSVHHVLFFANETGCNISHNECFEYNAEPSLQFENVSGGSNWQVSYYNICKNWNHFQTLLYEKTYDQVNFFFVAV